jgi:hypothetical protein
MIRCFVFFLYFLWKKNVLFGKGAFLFVDFYQTKTFTRPSHPAVNFLALKRVYMRQSKVFRPADPIWRQLCSEFSFDCRKISKFFLQIFPSLIFCTFGKGQKRFLKTRKIHINAHKEKFAWKSAGGHGKFNTRKKTFRGKITKCTIDMPFLRYILRKETIQKLCKSIDLLTGPINFLFCRLYPFPPAPTAVFGSFLSSW